MDRISTADLALARRVEAADAANGFRLTRALAAAQPGSGALAEPFLGGCAIFAGVGSPMTHALGIGMQGPASADELDCMEAFFRGHGSAVLIDLCPMADLGLLELIFRRGYRVIEFNNVMVRRIAPGERFPDSPIDIAEADAATLHDWSLTVARGFQERDAVDALTLDALCGLSTASRCYLARHDGAPAGGGAMGVHDGLAAFYGDATLLAARRLGIQLALIHARLRDAAAAGCDLATAAVLPGSASHRNYERAGFELFYMRVNLSLPATELGPRSES